MAINEPVRRPSAVQVKIICIAQSDHDRPCSNGIVATVRTTGGTATEIEMNAM
jgi:hypothetical protein